MTHAVVTDVIASERELLTFSPCRRTPVRLTYSEASKPQAVSSATSRATGRHSYQLTFFREGLVKTLQRQATSGPSRPGQPQTRAADSGSIQRLLDKDIDARTKSSACLKNIMNNMGLEVLDQLTARLCLRIILRQCYLG